MDTATTTVIAGGGPSIDADVNTTLDTMDTGADKDRDMWVNIAPFTVGGIAKRHGLGDIIYRACQDCTYGFKPTVKN